MSSDGSSSKIPIGWEWALDIVDEANLATLGMPISWEKSTGTEHARIPVNPITGKRIEIYSGKDKGDKIKVGFINSTKGSHNVPGSAAPAAARVQRFRELKDAGRVIETEAGDILVPCLAHGDYVKVESTQLDHMQSKANILKRQNDLIEKLNEDKEFASFLIKQPGMKKFFIKSGEKYYGTLLFYEVYFNDIDNLWLICSACNLQKSDSDTLDWLENQWLYGKEFLDYLAKKGKSKSEKSDGILEKTKDKKGLAEVAIEWFWKRHANYISTSQTLYENVVTPIQILNKRIDHIIGSENLARAERLQLDLDIRLGLMQIIPTLKVGPPRNKKEALADDSDPELRLSLSPSSDGAEIEFTKEDHIQVAKEAAEEAKTKIEGIVKASYKEKAEKKRKMAVKS